MLGKTVIEKENRTRHFDMAGSGFESTVRLAKVHTKWTPIFKQKKSRCEDTRRVYL
jgi:prephenate dehydrogenase